MRLAIRLLVFGIGLLFWQCQEENIQQADLIGRWEIEEATRNGQSTGTLDNLFFEFFEDGQMRTNMSGTPMNADYDLEDGQLQQRSEAINADYQVQDLTDSTLVLSTSLRGYSFVFRLRRTSLD